MKKLINAGLACFLFISLTLSAVGGRGAFALFFDKDTDMAKGEMAEVAVSVQSQQYNDRYKSVSATIGNQSNTDIYLRVGVIIEEVFEDGTPMIPDTSNLLVSTPIASWQPEYASVKDAEGKEYKKWFLKYAYPMSEYIRIPPGAKAIGVDFQVLGYTPGSKLDIRIIPEAIQADTGDKALDYLKDPQNMNPPW